jgi:hypothetical protein
VPALHLNHTICRHLNRSAFHATPAAYLFQKELASSPKYMAEAISHGELSGHEGSCLLASFGWFVVLLMLF